MYPHSKFDDARWHEFFRARRGAYPTIGQDWSDFCAAYCMGGEL